MCDRQEYGPLNSSARLSSRVAQVRSLILPLDDAQTPLPPPASLPSPLNPLIRELQAKDDEVAVLRAQRSDQDSTIRMAEGHLHDKETYLITESQQRDLATTMAKEVHTGAAEVFQRYACEKIEQTAQASRDGR